MNMLASSAQPTVPVAPAVPLVPALTIAVDRISALEAAGAATADPVRWRLITAMARRAHTQPDAVQRLLAQRLHVLLNELPDPALQGVASSTVAAKPLRPSSPQGPLAGLLATLAGGTPVEEVAHHAALPAAHPGASAPAQASRAAYPAANLPELKTVQLFRSTWSRLGVEQRLSQALAKVPENAGPLNTQRLLNQALTLMNQTAPGYLEHLLNQVDALLWLEQASGMAPPERKAGNRRG
ncbi:DUF2894 domain-containing protein [Ideonella margarita]|uniref:DUF2894 domain-containing protein n=1 Tax=Ideonella margarita TaxID=2984191 RepID=A0ABU9C0J2_9BURK